MEKLGINLQLLVTQIVNFGIMVGILTFLLYKPILKVLDERKKKIEDGLKFTEEAKKEKERLDELKRRILKEAKEEGQRIVKESIIEAKKRNEEILLEGKRNLGLEKKKMLSELRAEEQKMLDLVAKKASQLAVLITERILGETLDGKQQEKLIEESLKKINLS